MDPTTTERVNHGGIRRIRNELRRLWADDPPMFCRPGASPVTDLFHWEVVIDGPAGSPYEGGTFPLDIDLSDNYPFRGPKITFKTEVFHPNIDMDGEMVLNIFREKWLPSMKIHQLLRSIVSVLYDPLLDFPVHRDIAHLYKNNIKQYEELAMVWTREYSSTPIVSHYPTQEELDHCVEITAQAALERAAKQERLRRQREEARLRRRQKEEEERERRRKEEEERQRCQREQEKNETILQWLWRKVLAFLFRDGPLPCDVPDPPSSRRKLAQD